MTNEPTSTPFVDTPDVDVAFPRLSDELLNVVSRLDSGLRDRVVPLPRAAAHAGGDPHGCNEEAGSMLMRFDPFRELDRLTQQGGSVFGRPALMAIDAYRHGDEFVVQFDLPGVDSDSIDVTVEKNVLSVRAERRSQPAEGDEVLANERPQGKFSRQLFLAEGLDTDRISARYENGVLTVTIPVAEKAKPRKVPIAARAGQGAAIEAESKVTSGSRR